MIDMYCLRVSNDKFNCSVLVSKLGYTKIFFKGYTTSSVEQDTSSMAKLAKLLGFATYKVVQELSLSCSRRVAASC